MIAGFVLIGLLGGLAFFGLLRWNTALYVDGGGVAMAAALHIGRLAGVAGLLVLAAHWGALALLLTALGVVAARPLVVRMVS